MPRVKHSTLIALVVFLSISRVSAAGEPDPLFASSDVLRVTISAPLTTLTRKRSKTNQLDGTFSYQDAAGEKTFERANPISGEPATRAAAASVDDALRAVKGVRNSA